MSEQIDFDKIVQEFRGSYVSDSFTIKVKYIPIKV